MTSDTHLAFATLAERAASLGGVPDRISLRDYVVEVDIGAFQTERGARQRVRFNVVVEVLPQDKAADDDVDRILSYDHVTNAIDAALAEERLDLLETLADRVAGRILAEPQAARVFVRIEKLDRGPGALGVEIVRDRMPGAASRTPVRPLAPSVVHLSNAAIASPFVTGWLDSLEAPAILCVGAADVAPPRAEVAACQRRIDLLAIEQNAWCLAARDERCLVVRTRTELDWAMQNGRTAVWAPSKIVLDATEQTPALTPDAVALTFWFANLIAARDVLLIGVDPAPGCVTTASVRRGRADDPDLP